MSVQKIGEFLWRAMPNGDEKRSAYYCSREWSERKEAVKIRSKGVCERCQMYPGEHVHHLNYLRIYAELLTDLWHLCRGCHEFIHAKSPHDPLTEYEAWMATERQVSLQTDGTRLVVLCPFCGSLNCHMGEPCAGTSEDACSNQGCIVIPMYGECQHEWELVLCGHKGTLHAFVRNGRELKDA